MLFSTLYVYTVQTQAPIHQSDQINDVLTMAAGIFGCFLGTVWNEVIVYILHDVYLSNFNLASFRKIDIQQRVFMRHSQSAMKRHFESGTGKL